MGAGRLWLGKPTVLVLGSARSGTTWFASLLAAPLRYRLLFEPFHPGHVQDGDLVANRYLAGDEVTPEVTDFLWRALDGRIPEWWDSNDTGRLRGLRQWRWLGTVRICKSIRTNLLIPVYRSVFGDALPIVALVRHPFTTVDSQLRMSFPWLFEVDSLLESSSRLEQELGTPAPRLRSFARTPVGALGVRWALENAHLLRRAADWGVEVVIYEELQTDPVGAIRSLADRLGLKTARDLADQVGKLSPTTHPRSPLWGGDGASDEFTDIDPEGMSLIREICDTAGIDLARHWETSGIE